MVTVASDVTVPSALRLISDIALADNLGHNRHRRGIAAATGLLRRAALPGPPDDAGDNQQSQDGCQNEPSAGPGRGSLRRTNWGGLA